MAFLRRRGPEPVTEPSSAAAIAPIVENCPFCESAVMVDADNPSDLLVAILLDQPGYPPHVVAHRACAERAAGRLVL